MNLPMTLHIAQAKKPTHVDLELISIQDFASKVLNLLHLLKANREMIENLVYEDDDDMHVTFHQGDTEYKLYVGLGLCDFLKSSLIGKELTGNVGEFFYSVVKKHFCSWAHFSGHSLAPVPSHIDGVDSGEIYEEYRAEGISMWSIDKYGQMRWDLIDHMIKDMSTDLGCSPVAS